MKSILLIGVGRFGRHIAAQLAQLGHQVMAVDTDEARINEVMSFVTNAQIGDSTNAAFLRSLGVGNFDVCMVTISGNFQNSLETTSLLKELGAKCVVSRAERDVQAKFLLRNGADHVVYPEKQVARWVAIRYTSNHISDYIEIDDQHAIFEWKCRRAGSAEASGRWMSAEGSASTFSASSGRERPMFRSLPKPYWRRTRPFWRWGNIRRCRGAFVSEMRVDRDGRCCSDRIRFAGFSAGLVCDSTGGRVLPHKLAADMKACSGK